MYKKLALKKHYNTVLAPKIINPWFKCAQVRVKMTQVHTISIEYFFSNKSKFKQKANKRLSNIDIGFSYSIL